MNARLLYVLLLLFLLGGGYAGWQVSVKPSHDRDWLEHYAKTPDAEVRENVVQLEKVRNWNHDDTGVVSRQWLDTVVIDPADIERVWFVLSSFANSSYVGHSFLSFELRDGRAFTFSIEARREVGETYSAVRGLTRSYELWYGWGTERDFLGASLLLLDRPLEMYPLVLTASERAAVFRAAAAATHAVAESPRFYDTFTANCTNLLARAINDHTPKTIPYHPAWNLPGLAPQFLADQGFIDVPLGAADFRGPARLTAASDELRATISQPPEVFSRVLRAERSDAFR